MRQNGDDHTAIPSVVRVQLGLLTLPTGPGGAEAYTHVLTNPDAL